ncbi:MAG TPA: membrane protein insertase YidC [Gemmatimonadaceae bacterium]|nr:membrane protein insertase YidC [Gemmatimonadaceae bacterium]
MNKRMLLALALSAGVIGLTQYLFPPAKPVAKPVPAAVAPAPGTPAQPLAPGAAAAVLPSAAPAVVGPATTTAANVAIDTAALTSARSTVRISSVGAVPVSVVLNGYKRLPENASTDEFVQLVRPGEALLRYALIVKEPAGNRVIDLATVPFSATRVDERTVTYAGQTGAANVQITYTFQPDSFLLRVGGKVTGLTSPAFLRVSLPSGLNSSEADSTEDQQHLAVAMKPVQGNTQSVAFTDLDPGERELKEGPFIWVASKSKFFITGLLTSSGDRPFDEVTVTGGAKTGKVESRVEATALQALQDGTFRFELYAGPQEWRRLVALGRDFENSNPYGGWLQGFVQPFATMVMKALLWMHETLKLNYGWVLVIFGVAVRLLLWPFNQRAMRTSMKMQVLQPELQAVQEKYKSDPQRMQQEVMRVYKEHDMSPFSALSGCLPMLLPMPVFITLFFVFQNTIEFRGVPFLHLADISQKDPTFIIPLLMAGSAFLLSWIGMRGMPPNPQAKIMAYMFPAMMFAFFFSAAAGLNLYYMVQNIAALPQQWLIANERLKSKGKPVVMEKGAPARPKKA